MNPRYLLDTNIVSYFLKGFDAGIRQRLDEKPAGALAISAVTAAELHYWIAKRPEQARIRLHIEDFLLRVPTLPWDAEAASAYGQLKAQLLQTGRPLAELDMQIAAHALALNLILVTHDTAFRHVPHLHLEDWVTATH